MSKQKHTGEPGQMKTYTGRYVDVVNTDPSTLDVADVAWGLGRIIRFNSQISHDYTVAHHCLTMSHLVPEEYALEALLHDAAEAYIGDIIWPVKAVLDVQLDNAISNFENDFLATLIDTLAPEDHPVRETIKTGRYIKSPVVTEADIAMGRHEWGMLGRGPEYEADESITELMNGLNAQYEEDYLQVQPWWAWLRRFHELVGTEYNYEDYVRVYFPESFAPRNEEDELRIEADTLRADHGMPPMSDEEWANLLEAAETMAGDMMDDEEMKRVVL